MKFPFSSESTVIRPGAIPDESQLQFGETEINGIRYMASKVCPPVSSVFSGLAYLRKLAGHRRRIRMEMARITEFAPKPAREPYRSYARTEPRLDKPFFGVPWGDLKMVNCFCCSEKLLGDSCEWIRNRAKAESKNRILKLLPPRIAAVVLDKAYCEECFDAAFPKGCP